MIGTNLLGLINETFVQQDLHNTSGSALQGGEDPGVVDAGVLADAKIIETFSFNPNSMSALLTM